MQSAEISDCVQFLFVLSLHQKKNIDPVCGSGHCHIVPLWAQKLDKNDIIARQASRRGGTLTCEMQGDRLTMAGPVVLYSVAELFIEE